MEHQIFLACRVCIAIASMLALSPTAVSFTGLRNQSTSETKQSEPGLTRCPVFVVLVKIDVTDTNGDQVTDLLKENFTVSEDRVRQQLAYFRLYDDSEKQKHESRYELGYYPTNGEFDGSARRIQVQVNAEARGKLSVHY